jgi:hypothetical protein
MEATEKVSLPVKPALATAANTVALGVAAVATGGTVAVVAAGAGLLLTGAAVKGTKKAAQSARKQMLTRTNTSGSRKTGTNGAGPLGGKGKPGGSGAGKKGSAGSGSAGKSGVFGGGRAGGRPGGAGQARGAGRTGGGSRSGSGWAGSGAGGGKPTSRSLGHRLSRVANSPARRWAQAGLARAARQAQTGAARTDAAVSAARSRARKAWLAGFRPVRRWVQRSVMGRDLEAEKKAALRRTGSAAEHDVKPTLSRGLVNQGYSPEYALNITPPLNGAATHASYCQGGTMLHHARQMLEYAAEWDAPGLLEIIAELDAQVAPTLNTVAEVYSTMADKSVQVWGFDDAIVLKFRLIGEAVATAAQMAATITSDIEITEEPALNRLRNPKVGDEKRDLAANGLV